MNELPLPFNAKGSRIDKGRVSGPPSKMYPTLRDLCDLARPEERNPRNNATITLEIDTDKSRYTGILKGKSIRGVESLLLADPSVRTFPFANIIAFRIVKVEIEELPYTPEA